MSPNRLMSIARSLLPAATALVSVAPLAGATPPAPAVRVGIYDYASVPPDQMARVLGDLVGLFTAVGADLAWVDMSRCPSRPPHAAYCYVAPDLTVVIATRQMADTLMPRSNVLGFAPRTELEQGRIAYVFYDRVRAVSAAGDVGWLAVVIAHELAHLLLPHRSHSDSGVMQAAWNARELLRLDVRQIGFTARQAEQIRRRVGRTLLARH
jgi:hypothetical protein